MREPTGQDGTRSDARRGDAMRGDARRREVTRHDGLPRSSEYVVACLLRAEPDSRGFVGISGTQMSAGTPVHTLTMEMQYVKRHNHTSTAIRKVKVNVNGDTNDIERVEFPVVRYYYLSAKKILRSFEITII